MRKIRNNYMRKQKKVEGKILDSTKGIISVVFYDFSDDKV